MPDAFDKAEWRSRLLASRRGRRPADRSAAGAANAAHLQARLAGPGVVCAFLPLPSEPLDARLLEALVCGGCDVLVPVTTDGQPLDWCRYPCPTARGAHGIAEPTGDRLGTAAITMARAVIVPALAVDRRGFRLGRGGGHYDRTLAELRDRTRRAGASMPRRTELIAVLYDEEILPAVPVDAHDVPVTAVVTPGGGIQAVG